MDEIEKPITAEEHTAQPEIAVKKSHPRKFSRSILILGSAACLFVLILGVFLGMKFLKPHAPLSKSTKTPEPVSFQSETMRARRALVSPLKESSIQVYADNKMVIRLDISKGAVSKETEITLIPYKDANANLQVRISPTGIKFIKPVSLTYDLSRTNNRLDAPKTVLVTARTTGNTEILEVGGTVSIPQLIARSTETATSTTARILTTGTYILRLSSKDQLANARKTLTENVRSLPILEAGSVLLSQNQTLTAAEKKRITDTAKKIISLKDPSPYELFPAILLQNKLKITSGFFIKRAEAADISAGFYEYRCKDRTLSVEEYVIAAQTAQMLGHEDIGDKCMDAAKNRVAQEARELLAQTNPPVSALIKMLGKVQAFGLADLDVALSEKLDKVVTKKIEDILKDPNATSTDVVKALQEAQLNGNDTKYEGELTTKIQELAGKEFDQVMNDPNANMVDIAKAVQKAQALGLEGKADTGIKKLQDMSNRTSEQILDNSHSSAKELQDALAQAVKEGKDQKYKDKIRDRIKDAKEEEAKPTPKPSPKVGDSEENLEVGIDPSIIGLAFLSMMGLDSFDEASIKKMAQEQTDKANELLDMAPEICDSLRDMLVDFPDLQKNCDYLEGPARGDVRKAHDNVFDEAEKVGDIQSDDYEDKEYEMHMEIEITPTPESDYYQPEETDDTSDNNDSDIQTTDE